MIYGKKIHKLIEAALIDGELTEKERHILLKRAEEELIDLDEFEMVLDALIHERFSQKKASANPKSQQPTQSRQPENQNKCLACGAERKSFTTKCSDCGTLFIDTESFSDIIRFNKRLDEIEEYWSPFIEKKGCIAILGKILLWIFFWPILFYIQAWRVVNYYSKPSIWTIVDSKKENAIINYPVPVSQKTILEFLTLCSSKIQTLYYPAMFSKESKHKHAWNKVWLKKIDQIYTKASLAMDNDNRALEKVQTIIEDAQALHKKNEKKISNTSLFVFGMVVLFTSGIIQCHRNIQKEEKRNTYIVEVAEKLVEKKNYAGALQMLDSVDGQYAIAIRSKVQLSQLTEKLNEIENLLLTQKYDTLQLELIKLKWFRYSPPNNSTYVDVEKKYFASFIHKKALLNDQLPEEFRITIESKDSF
jgi:hypothetical protein